MIVEFKYKGQSAIVSGLSRSKVAFATNEVRETAFFKGALGRPLVFREAMGALHDVVISDFKYHPRDRFEFQEWLRREDEKFVQGLAVQKEKSRKRLEELEAQKAALDDMRRARLAPFYKARKAYFEYVFTNEYELNYLLDPVITVHPDELFFEAFSKDESTYARLGARYDIFERIDSFQCGTTNIDFSARLAKEMDRIRSYRRTELDIAPGGLEVKVGDLAAHKEKKIDLPDSWVNGFLQVQSTMAMGLTKLRVAAIDMFNIVRFLKLHKAKKSPRALRYELVPGKRVKVVFEPWEHVLELSRTAIYDGPKPLSIRTWGRDRLKVLSRLLPVATTIDVYLAGFGLPSIYVLDLGGLSTFTLGLSGWTENDWTGGAKFDLLTRRLSATPEELMLVYETLRETRRAKDTDLAMRTKLGVEKTRSVLSHLCQIGRAMLDLSTGTYRHRDLFLAPLTLKDALRATQPAQTETSNEAKSARAIFEADLVKIIARRPFSGGFKVSGSARTATGPRVRPQITVNHAIEIVEGTCTCSFFASHAMTKGPCEHLLALRLAHMARLDEEDKAKGGS
ncbi:MAG: SWIM zinc finger family protein [Labilithrix sp.]|nr:SWIM zinc finger family protein [Labilithrix sp.]